MSLQNNKFNHQGAEVTEKILKSSAFSVPLWFILLVLILTRIPAKAQTDPTSPDPRFGTIEAYTDPDRASEANVGWERIIFYWSEIERNGPDDWNWFHAPNARINAEIASGREVIGLIAHTPKWATDGIEGAGVPRGLYLPLNDPRNYWAQYIRYLITVYGDRIHHWVIWNEPDIPLETFGAQWQGSIADYYQLVKVASLVAHEVDPDAVIHLGGLTYWHNPTYLREFLAAASTDPTAAANRYYFDVLSVHVYFKPETTIDIINSLHTQMAEFGIDKPIWLNETNAPPYDDPAQSWDQPVFRVTQTDQATFLLQEFALALSLDVDRIGVYKWADIPQPQPGFEPYGLIRSDGSPRPAYDAYKVITTYYAHTTDAIRIERPELWVVALDRGDQVTRVVWARRPYPTLAILPALADSAFSIDQANTSHTIYPILGYYILWLKPAYCDPDCLVGGPPIVLVESAHADLSQPDALGARFVRDLTPKTKLVLGGAGFVVFFGFGGLALFWRFFRRQRHGSQH